MNNEKQQQEQDLFQDLPLAERERALRDNAYKSDTEHVKRFFTDEEMAAMKDEVAKQSIIISEKEDELKEISSELKGEIKELKTGLRGTLSLVKAKYREHLEEVFMMADQTEGIMSYYTKDGIFIRSRKLNPSERQTMIPLKETGTN